MMDVLTQFASGEDSGILGFLQANPIALIAILVWTLAWKGVALWKAARLSHKWWFIVIMIANTVGILEIIYIYFIARKYTVEEEVVSETK